MSVMKNKETISDSKDCEKIKVTLALMTELEKGDLHMVWVFMMGWNCIKSYR